MTSRIAIVVLALAGAASAGCTKSISMPMRSAAAPSMAPPPGMARVLVLRPSRTYGWVLSDHVSDGDRAFLGDAVNNSVFASDLPPGDHQLCVGVGMSAGPLLKATLAAGKTYVVRVDLSMGGPSLKPIAPHTDDMKQALDDVQHVRGSELVGPTADGALSADNLKFLFGKCLDATRDASPEDKAKLVLKETDALD